jgi:8-oxo-dGTP pyrophosphatase MutT (NUDIX family)
MPHFHAIGDWPEGTVRLRRSERRSSYRTNDQIEAIVTETWREQSARPGVLLFDGAMCRLESFEATPQKLELLVSDTSYRRFLGTNMHHPELAERFGPEFLANPLGASCIIQSRDGFLLMGRRNESVAYYPSRVHPFAGCLEPADSDDVFQTVRRELREELALDDPGELTCYGLAEDRALRQPELIFRARVPCDHARIATGLDPDEHGALWSIPSQRDAVESALRDPILTPAGVAALLLWGRATFGADWFDATRANVH